MVVGAGYIAVELAGILQILGAQVDLFIRGELPLRSMEPDIVSLLVEEMSAMGVNWVRGEIASLSEADDGSDGEAGSETGSEAGSEVGR